MKYLLLLFSLVAIIAGASSCRMRTIPGPARTFVYPEHRTRHHWGLPRRHTLHSRYWGRHRYGPRPHPRRGMFR